ncbi:MAG: hypothetical protein ACMUHM_03315 [Thermoplasmatota archaeon]
MKYGDKDGLKEVYDDDGELLLHPNEKVLVSEENVVPTFKSTWRYYGGDYLLEPSKGTIYLTNERLVFINIPERMFAIGGDEARAVGSDVEKSFELGDLTPGTMTREYFDIPNIEVMASEKKEGAVSVGEMVNVYVLSSGNQFHLSMVLPSDSDLLKRLMNKRVENLDQLVNNLKDYFQKDDWMFTEAEKKLFIKDIPKVPEGPKGLPPADDQKPKAVPQLPAHTEEFTVFDPTIPKRRLSDPPGGGSIGYFQNLYRKGLIRDEIYRRLMAQYGIDPNAPTGDHIGYPGKDGGGQDDLIAAPSGEPVETEAGEEGAGEAHLSETDDELLSMLDDTLSDFSDELEEAEPVSGPADEPEEPMEPEE